MEPSVRTLTIDPGVRLLTLHFKVHELPPVFRGRIQPPSLPKRQFTSKLILKGWEGKKCDIGLFPTDLDKAGYLLTKASCHALPAKYGRNYYAVKFTFFRADLAVVSPDLSPAMEAELKNLCASSLWEMCGFASNFVADGFIMRGEYVTTLVFSGRMTTLGSKGESLLVWPKRGGWPPPAGRREGSYFSRCAL